MVSAGGSSLQLSQGPIFIDEVAWTGGADGCSANYGGSGGGASAYYAAPSYMALPNGSKRPVPDIALNADWLYHPQNFYFNGSLSGTGGTSIVAPEVAGFFAQANAYMLYVGSLTGGCSGVPCAPVGNGDWYLYFFGLQPHLAPHFPFHDITSGCNNNDITIAETFTYFGLHLRGLLRQRRRSGKTHGLLIQRLVNDRRLDDVKETCAGCVRFLTTACISRGGATQTGTLTAALKDAFETSSR